MRIATFTRTPSVSHTCKLVKWTKMFRFSLLSCLNYVWHYTRPLQTCRRFVSSNLLRNYAESTIHRNAIVLHRYSICNEGSIKLSENALKLPGKECYSGCIEEETQDIDFNNVGVAYECGSVMKKRRSKMNKHKYKKLRKRTKFLRRRLKK